MQPRNDLFQRLTLTVIFFVAVVPGRLGVAAGEATPQAPADQQPSKSDRKAKTTHPQGKERREEFAFKSITDIQLESQPPAKTSPPNVAANFFARAGQADAAQPHPWALSEYTWVAPGVCHRPLYFEEVNLERHGLSFGIAQPAVSSAQFFGRTLALPYLMTAQPPRECVYTLGRERPGTPVPYYVYCPPWDVRAVTVESAIVAGAILVFP